MKLLEKHVVEQVRDFLALHNWRGVLMMQTIAAGAFRAGEPGQPDYLFLRYLGGKPGARLGLWIEFKRPDGRLGKHQPEWHERERARGGLVWVVADFDSFKLPMIGISRGCGKSRGTDGNYKESKTGSQTGIRQAGRSGPGTGTAAD